MIQLPSKFILLGTNPLSDSFLLEMKFLPITGDLHLAILIYKLKIKLSPNLIQSIISNDTNSDYFNKIAKELVYSTSLSYSQSENVMLILQRELNNPQNNNQPLIQVNFNINPQLCLNLTLQQIFTMHVFVAQFVVNYVYYKTEYYKQEENKTEIQIETNQESSGVTFTYSKSRYWDKHEIDRKRKLLDQKLAEQQELFNVLKEFNFDGLLKLIYEICDNNLLSYFITKYINYQLNLKSIENDFSISIDNNSNLIINIAPLIPNSILLFTNKYYLELLTIYDALINIPKELITKKLVLIFESFMVSIKYYLNNPNEHLYEQHLIIQILDQLFFIFAILNSIQDYTNYIIYPIFVNSQNANNVFSPLQNKFMFHLGLNTINQKYMNCALQTPEYKKKYGINSIQIKHIFSTESNSFDEQKIKILKEIIENNKYILDLKNTELFINNTFSEYNAKSQENLINDLSKQISLVYSNGNILIISKLIEQNVIQDTSDSLINYKNIDCSDIPLLQNHSIITDEYKILLQIQYKDSSLNQKDIPLFINKYCQSLTQNILPNLSNEFNSLPSPISTLDLLQNYILPFVNKDISIETELKILYKIVIPFLYDIFKVDEIFDTFQ